MRTSFNCRLVVAVLGYVGLGVLESWQSSVRLVLMLIGEAIMKIIPVLHQEVFLFYAIALERCLRVCLVNQDPVRFRGW